MLFIEDIRNLPKHFSNRFNPRPFTSSDDITGLCVYAYLREEPDEFGPTGSVYYIGEGKSSRPINYHGRVIILNYSNIIIMSDGHDDKSSSLSDEAILIHSFGRIVTNDGILENINAGGWRLVPELTEVIRPNINPRTIVSNVDKLQNNQVVSRIISPISTKKYIFDDVDCYDW